MLSGVPRPPHRAAVLGAPITHSLSPALHRAAYADLGLDDWSYQALEVADRASLHHVLGGGWAGLSLTMPLKRLVQPMLDVVTDLARDVGAVNTVTFGPAGRVGHNTDVHGVVSALAEVAVLTVQPGSGVVLGGGATAASAMAALAALGDLTPRLVVRDLRGAGDLLDAADRLGVTPRLVPWADAAEMVRAAAVVVSTVPASAGAAVVALLPGRATGVLLDVGYDPWPTPAADAWRRAGGTAVGGLSMLVHQAAAQVRLMTGRDPSLDAMRGAGMRALAERDAASGRAQA